MYRKEYVEALRLLSRAFDIAERRGAPRPVIVGGSTVEFYTGGAVTSGDFDLVAAREDLVAEALLELGSGARTDAASGSVASTIPRA